MFCRVAGGYWLNGATASDLTECPNKERCVHQINPKKLLHSKWTAVVPVNKEKHFLITEVKFSEEGHVEHCVLEAILSKRAESIDWQILKNSAHWRQGWI